MVERESEKLRVGGSSPSSPTIFPGCSEMDYNASLRSWSRRFESVHPGHSYFVVVVLFGRPTAMAVGTTHITFFYFFENHRPAVSLMGENADALLFLRRISVVEFKHDRIRFPAIHTRMRGEVVHQFSVSVFHQEVTAGVDTFLVGGFVFLVVVMSIFSHTGNALTLPYILLPVFEVEFFYRENLLTASAYLCFHATNDNIVRSH
jgi:hypothetical protein